MIMMPRIKVFLIATFVLLVLLSASIFAYSRMSGKEEETQDAPSTSKEAAPSVTVTETKVNTCDANKVEENVSAKEDEKIKTVKETKEAEESFSEAGANETEDRTSEPSVSENSVSPNYVKKEELDTPITALKVEEDILRANTDAETFKDDVKESAEDNTSVEGSGSTSVTAEESQDAAENETIHEQDVSDEYFEEAVETLVYEKSGTIFSLDLSSQASKDYGLGTLMNQNGARFYNPKCSPDGRQIAFYMCISYMNERNGIYVMNLDRSNLRQVSKSNSSFDFGQNGDSIVYFSNDRHQILQVYIKTDGPLEPEIIESMEANYSLVDIKYHGNYVYWLTYYTHRYRRAFDIRRKNIKDLSAESEIIYSDLGSVNFSISPDGSHLLVAKSSGSSQVIIFNTQTNSVVGPLIFDQNEGSALEKPFWSLDGNWIYAERKGENSGLVRFDFVEIYSGEPIKLQLVVPNFASVSGAIFVPTGLEQVD